MNARAREPEGPSRRKTAKGADRAERKKGGRCPICGKPTEKENRPFCSKHCADIDLGRWLDGRYAVPGEPIMAEPDEKKD